MRQYERSSVVVDQCTECRGIFLDRGELDRLIDAENAWHAAAAPRQPPPSYQPQRPYRDYDSDEYPQYGQHGPGHGYGHSYGKKRKRRGFLEDLFD